MIPDRPASIIAQNAVNPAIQQQQYILSIINKQLTRRYLAALIQGEK